MKPNQRILTNSYSDMSQCVPTCDFSTPRLSFCGTTAPDVPTLDYEVAELTWENGQLALQGFGPPRVPYKPLPPTKYPTWEKPSAGGTLESIVNQATRLPRPSSKHPFDDDDLVPWFDHHHSSASTTSCSAAMTVDALVPCSNRAEELGGHVMDSPVHGDRRDERWGAKRARVANTMECSSREESEREVCVGFTSTSFGGSHEYGSSDKPPATKTVTVDENDSVCHSRPQRGAEDDEDKIKGSRKASVSTKRSRAAAIHNQSERKRRDKINQRMKTLQKLVPNSSKTDKASMLDEVIEYLKQLQAQVQMMNRMSLQPMMLPLAALQQLQMSMMAPMGIGVGMGMGFTDTSRPNIPTISPAVLHPTAFMPMATSWDGGNVSGDRLQPALASVMPDPLSAFLACQAQPMAIDAAAYGRMAAVYQQIHQHPPPTNSND